MPLEEGLTEFARDMPGQPGKLAKMLGERMSAGESLPQILASEPDRFPPVWRAVVEAGLKSGQLAAAWNRCPPPPAAWPNAAGWCGAALLYPLIVVAVAYGVFVFQVTRLAPVMSQACAGFDGAANSFLNGLVWLGDTVLWWAILVPAAVALFLGLWWRRTGARFGPRGRGARPDGRFSASSRFPRDPPVAPRRADGRVRRDPLLAGQAAWPSGGGGPGGRNRPGPRIRMPRGRSRIVSARRCGSPPRRPAAGVPPLLGWLLVTGVQRPNWVRCFPAGRILSGEGGPHGNVDRGVPADRTHGCSWAEPRRSWKRLFTFTPIWKLLMTWECRHRSRHAPRDEATSRGA